MCVCVFVCWVGRKQKGFPNTRAHTNQKPHLEGVPEFLKGTWISIVTGTCGSVTWCSVPADKQGLDVQRGQHCPGWITRFSCCKDKNKQPRPSCHCGSSIDTHLTSLSRNSEEMPTTTPFSWSEAARGSEYSLFGRSVVGLQSVLPLEYQVFVNPESIQKESGGICEILLNLEATNWRFMNMDYTNADILMSTKHVSQQPGWDWTQNLLVTRKLPRWMWLTACLACRTYRCTDHWLTGCHRTLDLPVRTHASGTVTGPPFFTVAVHAALPRTRFWNTGTIKTGKTGKTCFRWQIGQLGTLWFPGRWGQKTVVN